MWIHQVYIALLNIHVGEHIYVRACISTCLQYDCVYYYRLMTMTLAQLYANVSCTLFIFVLYVIIIYMYICIYVGDMQMAPRNIRSI